jgi:hypothetical protein
MGRSLDLTDRQKQLVTLFLMGLRREEVAEAIWPEVDRAKQRNNMGVQFSLLRRVVEPWGTPTFVFEDGLRRVDSDHARVLAALEAGDAEAVLAATATPSRRPGPRRHRRAPLVAARGGRRDAPEAAAEDAEPDVAERYLTRVVELDPLDEEALRSLLRHLAGAGRRARRSATTTLRGSPGRSTTTPWNPRGASSRRRGGPRDHAPLPDADRARGPALRPPGVGARDLAVVAGGPDPRRRPHPRARAVRRPPHPPAERPRGAARRPRRRPRRDAASTWCRWRARTSWAERWPATPNSTGPPPSSAPTPPPTTRSAAIRPSTRSAGPRSRSASASTSPSPSPSRSRARPPDIVYASPSGQTPSPVVRATLQS